MVAVVSGTVGKQRGLSALLLALVFVSLALHAPADASEADVEKARLIVITDIGTEPDDIQSMVRLLTYANDIDIEGLIASTSRNMPDRVNPEFIEKRIGAYGEALPNLRVHDPRYPDAEALLRVVRASDPAFGMAGVGEGATLRPPA